jgi:hypothetical protein
MLPTAARQEEKFHMKERRTPPSTTPTCPYAHFFLYRTAIQRFGGISAGVLVRHCGEYEWMYVYPFQGWNYSQLGSNDAGTALTRFTTKCASESRHEGRELRKIVIPEHSPYSGRYRIIRFVHLSVNYGRPTTIFAAIIVLSLRLYSCILSSFLNTSP